MKKVGVAPPEKVWLVFSKDGRMLSDEWFTTRRAARLEADALEREHGEKWICRRYDDHATLPNGKEQEK